MEETWLGKNFIWWKGVVEDRQDPLFLGRCRCRIFGWHTENKTDMPTENLPWAMPSLPIDNGRNAIGPREGDWVWGFFLDGNEAQMPVMVGFMPGIPEDEAPLDIGADDTGFADPTPAEKLNNCEVPRPPEFCPIQDEEDEDGDGETTEVLGRFSDPDKLPGDNVAFGELKKDYDSKNYKWDVNHDGKYDAQDAKQISDPDGDGVPGSGKGVDEIFSGEYTAPSYPMSRYPLKPFLNEPTTPRIQRNEKIEETIIAKKRGDYRTAEAAGHESTLVGSDEPSEAEAFAEPECPYDAVYPYDHVYESESGHYVEIDDTPGAERIHHYHRSGTFREYHPDGSLVDKVMKKSFHFVVEDYNFATQSFANMTAAEQFRIKAGMEINMTSGGAQNRDVGANMNTFVHADENKKVEGESFTVIVGDTRCLVTEGQIIIQTMGLGEKEDIQIISAGKILLKAEKDICLKSLEGKIIEEAGEIHHGPALVESNVKWAATAGMSPLGGSSPADPMPCPHEPEEIEVDEIEEPATIPEGFLWDEHKGDLWKPISDGDGNAVSLSLALGAQHTLVEALPTGQLETVDIKYIHKDLSITTWTVVRPVHRMGDRAIEVGRYSGNANGGRDHYRWSQPGGKYPTQMFLRIGSYGQLILDSAIRHDAK